MNSVAIWLSYIYFAFYLGCCCLYPVMGLIFYSHFGSHILDKMIVVLSTNLQHCCALAFSFQIRNYNLITLAWKLGITNHEKLDFDLFMKSAVSWPIYRTISLFFTTNLRSIIRVLITIVCSELMTGLQIFLPCSRTTQMILMLSGQSSIT